MMLPPGRAWNAVASPHGVLVEHHPGVPRGPAAADERLVLRSNQHLPIPVMLGTRIGNERHRACDVLFFSAELRRPHDVDRDIAQRVLLEPFILQRNCAAHALRSRRRCEEDRSHLSRIGVERGSNGIKAGEARVRPHRSGTRASRQDSSGKQYCRSYPGFYHWGSITSESELRRENEAQHYATHPACRAEPQCHFGHR